MHKILIREYVAGSFKY